ncbi:Acetyltransferase (GNAT) family protein [Pustulibacterium marinum]|uniref:Acetyltransferase (GNAT) family protein n=1 Tax=Pustulibacterium marinum TaxID=1224947 RepID=A0A1I7I5N0_9FLAO|nr:GNAT family N-acetyltransferase [Pustulibacterium marinum]SFU68237.1 Acetyltransferase (GNAT) family protein [Pustulibacterium marinum]
MMVRLLETEHSKEAFEIIQAVVSQIRERNLDQWDELYPTQQIIINDISQQHAYGYFLDEKLVGYMALNEAYDVEYDEVPWKTTGKFLVVHRLSVHPNVQKVGVAKAMMQAVETIALENNYDCLRFDCFTKNDIANQFYQKLGFESPGNVFFRKGEFYCYEKQLR